MISRCHAITTKDTQCTRKTCTDSHYCKVHNDIIKKETKFNSLFLNTIEYFKDIKYKRHSYFLTLIQKVLHKNPYFIKNGFNFKDIYEYVVQENGGFKHPNGKGKLMTVNQFYGAIRSSIEEHSPSSRQYYFKGGKRTFNEQTNNCNLFFNEHLSCKNNACDWNDSTSVRGKIWFYKPTPNEFIPSESIIQCATVNRKIGFRGSSILNRQSDIFIKRSVV